jgi:DNA (cytosine-5)-methyltransferase 1
VIAALYNDIDPYAAEWTRNLIAAGHVAPGVVDERSIEDLRPADVDGPGQRHFFAGIGVWSYALRLAGVPDDASVWTGSCPCQPFSRAGGRRGAADERHLWPAWFRLIAECRPAVVLGEQVAGPDGRAWLAAVRADLEGSGYAVGVADLCAAGVGAPHIRQRLYFVARRLGDPGSNRAREHARELPSDEGEHAIREAHCDHAPVDSGDVSAWSACDWIPCSDGVARPVEPGSFPLAHGPAARVDMLRAYGNSIVAQVAATFTRAALASWA